MVLVTILRAAYSMANERGVMPAWLICDEIVSKMGEELLSQAISVMHEQLEKKRISLEGHLPTFNELEGEKEKDLFLISQLVKEHANIEKQFTSYLKEAKTNKEAVSRIDELQKFLLELRQILLLFSYSKACESWLIDVEKEMKEKSPEQLLAKSMTFEMRLRSEILEHALRSKDFVKNKVFSEQEMKIMESALNAAKGS